MKNLEMFFKQNVEEKEEVKYVASDRFKDENGKSIEWELKAISAQDDSKLRAACTDMVAGNKPGVKIPMVNTEKYLSMLTAATITYPDLGNAALQDSYDVKSKSELLTAMLLPGEYQDLLAKIQEVNGFKTINELVEEAKN